MSKKYFLLLLCIVSIKLSAQNWPNTLLWKITGNGLQKPSYLYGTMHLTDARIFNLGDSVFAAISKSDGFAIEIDPEDFTPFIIDEAKKSIMKTVLLKDKMNSEEFNKYGKALAKKLHKNENDITTADVLSEKNKWIKESYSSGKMQTFLDAYLFDIARRQGKWTGGVEDIKDQEDVVDLIDESDIEELAMDEDEKNKRKENNLSLDRVIKSYVSNDLNAIERLSSFSDSSYKDALLIQRNKKMALRMDSLGHQRSIVFAIGAAHLPGDEGLINLLKQKGFTVTPVFSSRKINAKDYTIANIELPWRDVKDDAGFYKVSMPSKPGDLTLYSIVNMKMYFDVFSSTIYMATALQMPYTGHTADSVLNLLASYYFGTKYSKGTPVTLNNIPGMEFTALRENYSHGYLLYNNNTLYVAIGMCMKGDTSAAPSINRFIHSFTILNNGKQSSESITYTNSIKAYRLQLPAQPKSGNDLFDGSKDSTIKRELNIVTDPVSGAYLFFGTNEAARGYNIINDSTVLQGIEDSQKKQFKRMDVDTMFIHNGMRVLEFSGLMAKAPLMMKAYYECRGNRWYALAAIYDSSKNLTAVNRFFNSFSINDYAPLEWNNYRANDSLFSTWAPDGFRYKKVLTDENDSNDNYVAFDTSRSDTYGVSVHHFSKYYWQNNDSALWEQQVKESVTYKDSLLFKKQISNGDEKGYEIEVQQQGSQNIKRVRMFLNGTFIYKLYTIKAFSEINNTNTNKFFEDFRFHNITSSNSLFVSKANVILNDIASSDSAIKSDALSHLSIAPFTKKDLPLLHKALLKTYVENEFGNTPKNDIKKIIISINDTSSYNFAKENYASADDTMKNVLLDIMSSFPTRENFSYIKDLLLTQPPHVYAGFDLVNHLKDTLSLTAKIFPGLLPLIKDTAMAPLVIEIANYIIDSGLDDKALLQPYQQYILEWSQKKYAIAKKDADSYDYINYNLIELLGKINNADCNTMLANWSLVTQPYLKMNAVSWMLHNNQSVNPQVILALAKQNNTRTNIYDTLKAYKKQNLFPYQYLTQKFFAESYAYVAASDDDEPSNITYLTQKVIDFKGKQSRFYFFKVMYGKDDDKYYSLACAGPFNTNINDVSENDATGDIYSEDFDESNLSAQSNKLILQMEEWYKWKDKKTKQ